MYRFMQVQGFNSFAELHKWSVDNVAEFWEAISGFGEIEFARPASKVLDQPGDVTTAIFFADAEISFPAHVLRHRGDRAAIVFWGENGVRREISFDDLRTRVHG